MRTLPADNMVSSPTGGSSGQLSADALVVDDNPEMLRFVASLLSMNGYRVSTVASAEAAIAANPLNFDLVITDLHMPGKSGIELMDWIHQRSPGPKVVLMSGDLPVTGPGRAALSRANALLKKPFHLAELRAMLRAVSAA